MAKKVYVFRHKTDLGHYTAEALTIRCVDDRFWKTFKGFLKKSGLNKIDPKTPAGGAKVFASPEKAGDRDFMFRDLDVSVRLHHVDRVMLFTHSDCGAYGGLKKFGGDEDKEFDFHTKELRRARQIILAKYPKMKIELYFLDQNGVVKVSPT